MFVMFFIVLLSAVKLSLLADGLMFVTFKGLQGLLTSAIMTFDCTEVITKSPRFLALFTLAFLSRAQFVGKVDTLCTLQYSILCHLPKIIAYLASLDSLLQRQLVFTLDDATFVIIMMTLKSNYVAEKFDLDDWIYSGFSQWPG